jgi:ribonuclease P protein component
VAPGATFDRDRRVRRRRDFQRVQGLGRRVKTRHFVLLVARTERPAPSGGPGPARLGIVASRRMGDAVARNRAKRLCRECFRLWRDLLPAGVDLVVIPRQGSDSLNLHEVRAEWAGAIAGLRRLAAEALAQSGREPHVSAAGPRGQRTSR